MDKQIINFKKEYQKTKKEKEIISSKLAHVRLILFGLFIIELFFYFKTHLNIYSILIYLGVGIFIIVAIVHHMVDKKIKLLENYLNIIAKYEARSKDTWKEETIKHHDSDIHFLNDLNVVGKNSLFQFLNFTSSLGGSKKLLSSLSLEKVNKKSIIDNQEAIKELKENFKFILTFQETLSHIEEIENIDYKDSFNLFNKEIKVKKVNLIISYIFSFFTILTLVLSTFDIIKSYYFVGLLLFQLAVSYFYMNLYGNEFKDISVLSRTFSGLKDVFSLVENQKFTSKKNIELQENIVDGQVILKEMIKLASLDSYRSNFITYVIGNVFFSLNFVLLQKYVNLLSYKMDEFKNSIEDLEELENLISLTTVGLVKKQICFPSIKDDMSLEFKEIKHPLLKEDKCISNDFSCNKDLNIITGSNMSGKTSFMRTIGINLILAYNGTFVTAENFSCSIMKIFTSINVKDDIEAGISTFYGELKRIKDVLDFSEKSSKQMIVFIDEIFKGTNYNDRILGAKETLGQLANLNCMVFLTTHDFELCEIKSKIIRNYHFSEKYENDKIVFDYKIKTGKCKTTNAKYLMEQMGIIK